MGIYVSQRNVVRKKQSGFSLARSHGIASSIERDAPDGALMRNRQRNAQRNPRQTSESTVVAGAEPWDSDEVRREIAKSLGLDEGEIPDSHRFDSIANRWFATFRGRMFEKMEPAKSFRPMDTFPDALVLINSTINLNDESYLVIEVRRGERDRRLRAFQLGCDSKTPSVRLLGYVELEGDIHSINPENGLVKVRIGKNVRVAGSIKTMIKEHAEEARKAALKAKIIRPFSPAERAMARTSQSA